MATVTGTVERVTTRTMGNGTTLYAILVDGTFYGTKTQKPACEAGDVVKFDFNVNDRGYKDVVPNTIKLEAYHQDGKAAGTKAPAAGKVDWDKKDARITWLACVNAANAFVGSMLTTGVFTFPASKKNADKVDAYRAMVLEEAERLFVRATSVDSDTASELAKALAPEEVAQEDDDPESW